MLKAKNKRDREQVENCYKEEGEEKKIEEVKPKEEKEKTEEKRDGYDPRR